MGRKNTIRLNVGGTIDSSTDVVRIRSGKRRTSPMCRPFTMPGNHEYYGNQIAELRMRETADCLSNHLLDNDTLVLGNVRFLGTALWCDFSLYDGLLEHE